MAERLNKPNSKNKVSFSAPKIPKMSTKVASVILIIIVSASAGFAGGYFGRSDAFKDDQNTQQAILNSEGELISEIAETVGPSVVSVDVEASRTGNTVFGPQTFNQQGAGTGFIVSSDGVIVTNRHVVPEGVERVSVTLSDGTELDDVSVVGRTNEGDPLDVAFLKVNDKKGKDLKPVKLGDSAQVKVGDRVVAIGNALGQFQNTVTSGIISGYGRNIQAGDANSLESLQNLFQTDAAINEGNSGGPLVNMQGEVIGINTAIAGDAQSIGFALPINDVTGLIKSVLEEGKLLRPYLGVRYINLDDDYAYEFNLDRNKGAYLSPNASSGPTVLPDSPAEKAGLKEKDIIIKVDDVEIDEKNGLSTLISQHSVGDKVTLTIIRDGQEMTLEATLEAMPEN